MTAPALTLHGVAQRFGAITALDVPALTIGPGLTAVLGRNGSGKSTLARVLATVWPPDVGALLVDGQPVTEPEVRLDLRRRLGYVAQDNALPPRMRVAEYCDYVAVLKEIGPPRRRLQWTHWSLTQVGLVDRASDRIRTLSGGMQRRLAIAQSLLGSPEVLVLDEPDASLDPEHRHRVTAMMAARGRTSTTVVMTHHPEEVAAVADRVLVLEQGRVVFDGPPAELAQRGGGSVGAGFGAVVGAFSSLS
ncbi:MAG: ATP-binding cassette domain-containing protein [Acidimicrobiia bacterium]|nr:ATP-binding cassette domain-containing protein [Acidimicrobiia bacterium]